MQLDQAIDYFLTAKQAENLSPLTLGTYERALFRMARTLPEVGEVGDIDVFQMRQYIRRLQDGGMRDVTVAHHVRHVKAFSGWCVAEGLLRESPFVGGKNARVKVPAFEHVDQATLTDTDFKAMLATCDLTTDLGRRDAAMLMVLLDTGVRVAELTGIKVTDVDLKLRQARVVGKGRKHRTVFFSAPTALSLTRYLARRHRKSDYLFHGGKVNYDGHLLTSGVAQRLRHIAGLAGVQARVNPHTFRHTFATNYLRLGGDPHSLQRILGHADVSTTIRNYAHLDTTDLQGKHDQFSPLAAALGRRA